MAGSPFIEFIRSEIRLRVSILRTEKTYIYWIKQFIYFHYKGHPLEMSSKEVKSFVSWLPVTRHVAVNTQKVVVYELANACVYVFTTFASKHYAGTTSPLDWLHLS